MKRFQNNSVNIMITWQNCNFCHLYPRWVENIKKNNYFNFLMPNLVFFLQISCSVNHIEIENVFRLTIMKMLMLFLIPVCIQGKNNNIETRMTTSITAKLCHQTVENSRVSKVNKQNSISSKCLHPYCL